MSFLILNAPGVSVLSFFAVSDRKFEKMYTALWRNTKAVVIKNVSQLFYSLSILKKVPRQVQQVFCYADKPVKEQKHF